MKNSRYVELYRALLKVGEWYEQKRISKSLDSKELGTGSSNVDSKELLTYDPLRPIKYALNCLLIELLTEAKDSKLSQEQLLGKWEDVYCRINEPRINKDSLASVLKGCLTYVGVE